MLSARQTSPRRRRRGKQDGSIQKEILADYPGIEEADVLACIAYGAEMSRERYVDVPTDPRS